jgi:hypothetical protein
MQQIKRNSDEFKTVKKIVTDPSNKAARMRSILLYALKSENSLEDAVILNKEKKNAAVLYNLAYESLQTYFDDTSKKLFRDERRKIFIILNPVPNQSGWNFLSVSKASSKNP